MSQTAINIACGDCYVDSWLNFDYLSHSECVVQANLLRDLPVSDQTADQVYSSHFLEHIPRHRANGFMKECYRLLKPGGLIRLVLPDWEELCRTYLALRHSGAVDAHQKADFLMLEMLDQCVRKTSGGELGAYYARLQVQSDQFAELIDFVQQRTGHCLRTEMNVPNKNHQWHVLLQPKKWLVALEPLYCRAVLALLPAAFRHQNVSLARIGEQHAWMYDFYSVQQLLLQTGFVNVQRMSETSSNLPDFPFYPLDIHVNGSPRKGQESMYIEARKP